MGCEPHQECLEPVAGLGTESLFTQALVEGLGSHFAFADANQNGILDLEELTAYIKKRMPELLKQSGLDPALQTPTFFGGEQPSLPIARLRAGTR